MGTVWKSRSCTRGGKTRRRTPGCCRGEHRGTVWNSARGKADPAPGEEKPQESDQAAGRTGPAWSFQPGVILSVNKLVFWAAQRRREAKTGAEITSPSCQVAASPSCCTCSRAELLDSSPRAGRTRCSLCARQGTPSRPCQDRERASCSPQRDRDTLYGFLSDCTGSRGQ